MIRDRKRLFPRMTRQELMLLQVIQRGRKANQENFIDLKQYTEPLSIQERRKRRFKAKAKILKDYEKLK